MDVGRSPSGRTGVVASGFLRVSGPLLASWRTPLGKVLAAALVLRLTGLTWGLPASDGWDDDGVAPRDFLVGVLMSYWPGHHYVYPPLHLIILTVVSLPIWIPAVVGASSLQQEEIIRAFIHVPTMTALAIVARATTAALSLGLLWTLAKIGEDLRGTKRAGAWVAAACGANAVFTYYSQTTNLDLAYLFWAVLALRWLVHAIVHREWRALRRVPIFAALAVATKDQAYALFVLGLPLAWAAWMLVDPEARRNARAAWRPLAAGSAIGIVLLLVIDGVLINPSGFADRIQLLLGTASQDHAFYAKSWYGRSRALADSLLMFGECYPWVFAPVAALGLVVALRAADLAKRAAGFAPLLFAVSFTVAFNMAARRSEHRFVLPQTTMWGLYAGLAFDAIHARMRERRPWIAWAVAVPCFLAAFVRCAAVDAAMVLDPRYDTEGWMRSHVRPGDRIEVYGNNVHLPRFLAGEVVERVDSTPVDSRNPLPGVLEVNDRLSNVGARRPRFIVVPEFWAHEFLIDPAWAATVGRTLSATQRERLADTDSTGYVHALYDGRLAYHWAHVSTWESRIWPRVNIHASLARDVWIFERNDGP